MSRWPSLRLVAILVLASALRLTNLQHARFAWPDEYRSIEGISVATPLFGAVYSEPIAMFGHPFDVAFYTSALFGVIAVLVTFRIGSQLRSVAAGEIAAVMLAVCGMHVNFSRSGYPVAMQTVLVALGLSLVLQARRRSGRRLAGMLAAGAPFGLAVLCYIPSYASVAGVAAALLLVGSSDEGWLTGGLASAVALAAGAVAAYFAGLIALLMLYPGMPDSVPGYFHAAREFQRLTAAYQSDTSLQVWATFVRTLARDAGVVWLAVAAAGFVAACYAGTRPRDREVQFFAVTFIMTFGLFTTAGVLRLHTVYDRHYVSLLPPLCALVAVGWERLTSRWGKTQVYLSVLTVAVVSSASAYRFVATPFRISPITSYLREQGIEKARVVTAVDLWESGDLVRAVVAPDRVLQKPAGAIVFDWGKIRRLYRDGTVRYLLTSGIGSRSRLGDGDAVLARSHAVPLQTWTHPYRTMGLAEPQVQDFALYDLSQIAEISAASATSR